MVLFKIILYCSVASAAQYKAILSSGSGNLHDINPLHYGAIGDGVSDDTAALQRSFKVCSEKGLICILPKNKVFLVLKPLFIWGGANIAGEDATAVIKFNVTSSPYLLNLGISGRNKIEQPFSGKISNIKFKIVGGNGGRIIFLWRTQSASIVNNVFDVGRYAYSATSSGNNNNWLKNGFKNSIRKNITIKHNTILAKVNNIGSEGIGLGHFDGAIISDNSIIGVGDDPIGIHFSTNIKIYNNKMKSVDGRLFVANSRNVDIVGNVHERIASLMNNKFYRGISLLYIGFEHLGKKNNFSAPVNINVQDNVLHYPEGAIDAGAAIYIYGPRNVNIERNNIINDSNLVTASAIHLLPAPFSEKWTDPGNIDEFNIARVWDISISNNISAGTFPQKMIMTGNCVDYVGKVLISDNLAKDYQFYCPKVEKMRNKKIY
ncbi:MAG: hypothetical protein QM504_06090 [Pseudomonadota bacterium]